MASLGASADAGWLPAFAVAQMKVSTNVFTMIIPATRMVQFRYAEAVCLSVIGTCYRSLVNCG
jgi:hypothetical protein